MIDADRVKRLSKMVLQTHEPYMPLYQILADMFYPERADFTSNRSVGREFADTLMSSTTVLARRDLGDALSAMRTGDWYSMGTDGAVGHDELMWMEWGTERLMRLQKDRLSGFIRSTKEVDNDFVTFGDGVISIEMNKNRNGLLYRGWHLRDCAWFDDESGVVDGVVRKWKPKWGDLLELFGDAVADDIKRANSTDLFTRTCEVHHVKVPSRMVGESGPRYASIYLDVTHGKVMEFVGMDNLGYVVPRFRTLCGSPYGYSPTTMNGLPDGRAIQIMQHTLMEAANRYTRPPMVGVQKVIRGDVNLGPDEITWIDEDYDQRTGDPLRTVTQNSGGFPIGIAVKQGVVDDLNSAFYSGRVNLPQIDRDVTAYEFSERMKRWREENTPLFEPIENQWSAPLCEESFVVALAGGLLGSPHDVPPGLRGRDISFKFVSPITSSSNGIMTAQYQNLLKLAMETESVSSGVSANANFDIGFRDAMSGMPERWKNGEDRVLEIKQAAVAMAQQQQQLEAAG